MNLVIDRGNTAFKLGIFKGKECVDFMKDAELKVDTLHHIIEKSDVKACILSSVANVPENLIDRLKKLPKFLILNHGTKIPILNSYNTPETLGNDRLANAVAAHTSYPNKNVLIIDMGTCMKFDLVSNEGTYLGGAISLGMKMRYTALHTLTEKLPLVDPVNELTFVGKDTNESIQSGVFDGMLLEIEGWISRAKNTFESPEIVATGGDLKYFDKALKNSIFADPFFTLKGLNAILETNV